MTAEHLTKLYRQRDKLLGLHYADQVSADQFCQEQARITAEVENHETDALDTARQTAQLDDLADKFEQVADLLDRIDLDTLWDAATETERRVMVDELLQSVTVYPERLQVTIHGAPALNVAFSEVGLKESKDSNLSGVGGGITPTSTRVSGELELAA